MSFTPSKYQQAIYDFVANPTAGNAVAEAVAGSGKTTTVVESLTLTQGRVIAVAFNKHIADEMQSKVPAHVQSATCHSVGNRFLRQRSSKAKLNQYLASDILTPLLKRSLPSDAAYSAQQPATRLVSLIKGTLADFNDRSSLEYLVDAYELDLNGSESVVLDLIPEVFRIMDNNNAEYDFDDMIYRPVRHGLIRPDYDYVFVDEAQDLNRSQIEFVKALSASGRILSVGDRYQSIYGFRGADYGAIPSLIEETDSMVLPLSICYRCPTSHVALAKTLVPHIEASPFAIEGTISHTTIDKAQLTAGMLVLCRTNAPLISTAYRLLRDNIPVIVRGRDIGQGLASVINKVTGKRTVPIETLISLINEWERKENARLSALTHNENRLQSLADKVECLYALTEGCTTSDDVLTRITTLFQDTQPWNAVVLSTVHKAKGLEANDVAIMRPDLLPLKTKSAAQQQQERNIQYVAYTRSKATLTFIEGD